MRKPRIAAALAAFACNRAAPQPAAPVQAASPLAACVDRELAARGLNSFGDAPGTMYPGGTPLFDERTGAQTDRVRYVLAHRPEIARACAAAK